MKNIYIYLSLLAAIVLGAACNNEWEDEQDQFDRIWE